MSSNLTWNERKQAAFEELLALTNAARGGMREDAAEFNGFLTAYCLLTGQNAETVYEAVQEALQARHERAVMEAEA